MGERELRKTWSLEAVEEVDSLPDEGAFLEEIKPVCRVASEEMMAEMTRLGLHEAFAKRLQEKWEEDKEEMDLER